MKSNVTLKSNIYINKSARSDDIAFLQHIRDYRILKRKRDNANGLMSSNASWMVPVQEEILRQGQPNCTYEKGTMSWGVPVGGDHMHCRCEQYDCHHYRECSSYWNFDRINRAANDADDERSEPDTNLLPLYTDHEKVSGQRTDVGTISPLPDAGLAPAYPLSDAAPLAPEPAAEPEQVIDPIATKSPLDNNTSKNVRVVEQSVIIKAQISERMWVNAAPGTGKTYTVIQRLKHLLASGMDGSILVLCFSKNAVQVVRERLIAELGLGAASYIEDGSLVIRTFDSFASYMLDDELNDSWDYDMRIEEFIKMLNRNQGTLNDMFQYLIVDEIQDTVGVRARMLLAMLDELHCGVLLLGDRCQAIFDWTIRKTNDMTFDQLMMELSKRHFLCYELEGNRRQSKELAKMGQELRASMLDNDEHNQELAIKVFKDWLRRKWRNYDVNALSQILSGSDDLILCKTNGEAAHISQRLFDTPSTADHIMKQSSGRRSLSSWIAKLLSGCDGQYMSKEAFCRNGLEYEIDDVESKWSALKSLDKHPHAPVLHVREVLDALLKLDSVPECCLNKPSNCAIISTVHRAKGSEAEHVFWLNTPLVYESQREQEGALSDALKAAYVAATRAKTEIHMLDWNKRPYLRLIADDRWIEVSKGKNGKEYCKGIAILPEDTDPYSFATEDIQMVLSCVERGFQVTLYPQEAKNCFEIYFDGQMIGTTSKAFTNALFSGFNATNHNKNWPVAIPDVYIASIVTIVAPGTTGIDQLLAATGCWLGVELGGFPRLEWY